jgi:hypothetical protein
VTLLRFHLYLQLLPAVFNIGMVLTDSEDDPRVERPVRKTKPTAILLQHSEKAALPSQRKAINDFRAAEAAKRAAEREAACAALQNTPGTPSSSRESSPVPPTPPTLASQTAGTNKRAHVEEIVDNDAEDENRENARINPKPSKGQCNNSN